MAAPGGKPFPQAVVAPDRFVGRSAVQCDLLKMSQCAGSESAGRIRSQPATPPSAAQSAVTSITVRNARSNAAIAPSVTPAWPARTAFNASLARAGGSPARWCEKLANNTAPSAATAKRPATRATALLTPEAMPARASPTDAITVDVSGGTVMVMPTASTQIAGNTPAQYDFPRSAKASSVKPQAAMRGPAVSDSRGPKRSERVPANDAPKPMIRARGSNAAPACVAE